MEERHRKIFYKDRFKKRDLLLFGVANLLWFILRTGTKPSRIVYPCQRAALSNSSILLSVSISLSLTAVFLKTKKFLHRSGTALALLLILTSTVVSTDRFWDDMKLGGTVDSSQEIQLVLEPRNATAFPASDIYAANGRLYAHVSELVHLMGSHGLLFYRSDTSGACQGPDGLIARDDVVLIKINEEWPERGGTNTDVIKELIQVIVNHPDGFIGEIVVADNGQWGGGMDHGNRNNAEDHSQSTQDVVDMFSGTYCVSTFDWKPFWRTQVEEFSAGNMNDGYILYPAADPVTTERVSYPKFTTVYGTHISGKYGMWNGSSYDKSHLKLINLPVLKCHDHYGFSGAIKHYIGFQAESYSGGLPGSNAHLSMRYGGIGYLMKETILPTLNIIDAIWISATPGYYGNMPQQSLYSQATRVNVLAASTDPAALDYWAAKHILLQAATVLGKPNRHTVDPDSTDSTGLYQVAPGIWLPPTIDQLLNAGYNVTADEDHMNVYVYYQPVHDIAVASATPYKRVVAQEYPLDINVTVENQGDFTEESGLMIHADTHIIHTETMTLASRSSTTVDLTWDTAGWAKGNYTITVYVSPVLNETDLADNNFTDGWVIIAMIGDITGPEGWADGKVDIRDVAEVAKIFGSYPGYPDWNSNCDINNDKKVDIWDVALVARHFGEIDP